jgi:hypothetical protein
VHPAAFVSGALEGPFERRDQAGVLVGDHQLDPGQAALLQPGQQRPPEHLVLAVADVEAEHLAAAVGGDAGGDHRHRDHLGGGVADMEVGRVEIDVGDSVWSSRRVRDAVTTSSRPAQTRETSDLEIPESMPRAATKSSTLRVDTPWT